MTAFDVFSERVLTAAGLTEAQLDSVPTEHAAREAFFDVAWTAYALGWVDAVLAHPNGLEA